MGKSKGAKSGGTPAAQTDKKGSASSKTEQKNAPVAKETTQKGGKKGGKK